MPTEYPVARIYKDTGTFECVKAVESGFSPNLEGWTGTYSGNTITLNNGIHLTFSVSGSWTLSSGTAYLNFYDYNSTSLTPAQQVAFTLDASGNVTPSISLSSTINSQPNVYPYSFQWWNVSGLTTGYTVTMDYNGTNSTTANVGSNLGVGLFSQKVKYNNSIFRISNSTPLISKQGTATFSKIVEETPSLMTSSEVYGNLINFYNGEFIEGCYNIAFCTGNSLDTAVPFMQLVPQNYYSAWFNFIDSEGSSNYVIRFYPVTTGSTGTIKVSSEFNTDKWQSGSSLFTSKYVMLRIDSDAYSLSDIPYCIITDKNDSTTIKCLLSKTSSSYPITYEQDTSSSFYPWNITVEDRKMPVNVSISKDGVLTCAKLVEGNYETENRISNWATESVDSTSMILNFKNGYKWEFLDRTTQQPLSNSYGYNAAPVWIYFYPEGVISEATLFTLSTTSSGNKLTNLVNPTANNTYIDEWNLDKDITVSALVFNGWNTANTQIRITTPGGKVYHYTNALGGTSSRFDAEESGDDDWILKSTDRFQNYLTST